MTTKASKRARIVLFIAMLLFALLWVYPLVLIILNSLKPVNEMMSSFMSLPSAETLQLERYLKVWEKLDFSRLFFNTTMYTLVSVCFTLLFASMAAYKLSRTKTRVSGLVFSLIILPMMVPFQTYMITLTRFAGSLHMMGNQPGYMVVQVGLLMPLAVFLFHGFVKGIPKELDECAYIDGASRLRTFFSIIFPLLLPITITVAVIDALAVWNDVVINMLMVGGKNAFMNIQNALFMRFSGTKSDWGTALPGIVISMVPNIVFFLFMQKYIVGGITAGAVKG